MPSVFIQLVSVVTWRLSHVVSRTGHGKVYKWVHDDGGKYAVCSRRAARRRAFGGTVGVASDQAKPTLKQDYVTVNEVRLPYVTAGEGPLILTAVVT